jgi:hypothetical protein
MNSMYGSVLSRSVNMLSLVGVELVNVELVGNNVLNETQN